MRLNLIIGLLITVLGILVMLTTWNPYFAVVAHGLLVGFGAGSLYVSAMWPAWSYYEHIKGRVMGLMYTGHSIGGAVIGILMPLICNPDNLQMTKIDSGAYFPKSVIDNFVYTVICISVGYILLGIIAISIISVKEVNAHLSPNLQKPPSIAKLLKSYQFWHLFVMFFFINIFWLYIAGNFKEIGLHFINDDMLLSSIGTFGSISGGAGGFL